MARSDELDEAIASWTRTRTVDEIVEILHDQEVPVSPINSIADIVSDPQFRERGPSSSRSKTSGLERPLLVPGVVPRLSRTPGVVPPLGQHARRGATEIVRAHVERHRHAETQIAQVGRRGDRLRRFAGRSAPTGSASR